jgi:hypothetical protein
MNILDSCSPPDWELDMHRSCYDWLNVVDRLNPSSFYQR